MKEKLIRLFRETCDNFEISRSKNEINIKIDSETRTELFGLLPKEIPVNGLKSFTEWDYDLGSSKFGFNFSSQPPIGIGRVYKTYIVKYGVLIPFISYLFINNYKRRRKYLKFIENYTEHTIINRFCDTLDKKITFEIKQPYIIHGTIFSPITDEEYRELFFLYHEKVKEYDAFILDQRLNKSKKVL